MEAAFNDEDESSIYVRGLGGYQRLEPGSWNGGRGQVDSSKLLAPGQRPLVRLRIGSASIPTCLMCWHRRLLSRRWDCMQDDPQLGISRERKRCGICSRTRL